MLQSWRGNCDLQLILYQSNPFYPDANEIARITDYVIGYTCKEGHTYKQDSDQMKSLITK